MLAKVVSRRRSSRASKNPFGARVTYICDKASAVALGNLAGCWQDATWQMTVATGLAPRIRQPGYHLILSWSDTESPTDQDMLTAARMIVMELCAKEHQYILAIHRDRRNPHIHLLLNRVHPITGAGLSTSHDFARLELACRRIERVMGWPADRGRFNVKDRDGSIQLVRKPAVHLQEKLRQRVAGLRPDGQAQRDHERRTGWPSLRDVLPEWGMAAIARLIDSARNWSDVHHALQRAHLNYRPHGSGARICRTTGEAWMAASQFGTAYGMSNLQARLGTYHPPDTSHTDEPLPALLAPSGISNAGLADLTPLRTLFEQRNALADWQRRKHAARMALRRTHTEEKQGLIGALRSLPRAITTTFRLALKQGQQQDRRDLGTAYPPPVPLPFRPLDEIARLAPQEMQRRRYRQVHRYRASRSTIKGAAPSPRDHTACRQRWCMPTPDAPPELQKLAGRLRAWNDQIRIGADGIVTLAMRQRPDSICGFLEMDLYAMTAPTLAQGGRPGITVLGDSTAHRPIIVPDIITTLSIIATGDSAETHRILVVPDPAGVGVSAYLDTLLKGSRPEIAVSNRGDHAAWQEAIQNFTVNASLCPSTMEPDDPRTPPEL